MDKKNIATVGKDFPGDEKTTRWIIIHLLIFMALMMPIMTIAQPQTLVLWHADGSSIDVDLYTEPKVTFTDSTLRINSTVLEIEFAADEIVRLTFKDRDARLSTLKGDANYQLQSGCIVFHKISAGDRITIYRSDGIRIPVHFYVEDGHAVLPLSPLRPGTYIISLCGRSSKFVHK